jgi:hypothetical protein
MAGLSRFVFFYAKFCTSNEDKDWVHIPHKTRGNTLAEKEWFKS